MKVFFALLVLLLVVPNSFSQDDEYVGNLILYPTFDHFERDSGIVYQGDFKSIGAVFLFGRHSHTFKVDRSVRDDSLQNKVNVKGKEIWGFKWGDALYRMSPFGELMYVAYSGNVQYYEICDYRHVVDIITPKSSERDMSKAISTMLVSETLNSPLYVVKNRRKFRKKHSEGVETILLKQSNGQVVLNCLSEAKENIDRRNCFLQLEN